MRFMILAFAAMLVWCFAVEASDRKSKNRRRGETAVAVALAEGTSVRSEPKPNEAQEVKEALAEVNADRAKRGLPPFQHDPLLSQAAYKAAQLRASQQIHGHLASDFDCLPTGAHADAAGCGALDDSWGWGTCCTYDNYSHAGAAWVRGADGRRYMHLFVRNTAPTAVPPPQRTGETISESGCSSGSCGVATYSRSRRRR